MALNLLKVNVLSIIRDIYVHKTLVQTDDSQLYCLKLSIMLIWYYLIFCRLTKPLTFADCVADGKYNLKSFSLKIVESFG